MTEVQGFQSVLVSYDGFFKRYTLTLWEPGIFYNPLSLDLAFLPSFILFYTGSIDLRDARL